MPGDGVDLALHLHLHTTSVVRLDLGILGTMLTMLNLHQAFEIMMIRRYRLLPLHFKYYRFFFSDMDLDHGIMVLEVLRTRVGEHHGT